MKIGKTWLPRGRSLAELSIGVTPLRFLNWPLIRGPFPYAGGVDLYEALAFTLFELACSIGSGENVGPNGSAMPFFGCCSNGSER